MRKLCKEMQQTLFEWNYNSILVQLLQWTLWIKKSTLKMSRPGAEPRFPRERQPIIWSTYPKSAWKWRHLGRGHPKFYYVHFVSLKINQVWSSFEWESGSCKTRKVPTKLIVTEQHPNAKSIRKPSKLDGVRRGYSNKYPHTSSQHILGCEGVGRVFWDTETQNLPTFSFLEKRGIRCGSRIWSRWAHHPRP